MKSSYNTIQPNGLPKETSNNVGLPPKPKSILHELVSQISSFQNYEDRIHTYVKPRETTDYLKICRVKTRLLKFIWELESWELNLMIKILRVKFEGNQNFGIWKLSSEIGVLGKTYINIEIFEIRN